MQSRHRIASSIFTFLLLIFSTSQLSAQATTSSGNTYMIAMLIVIGALVLVAVILMLSENFIQIEAKNSGMSKDQREGLSPSIKALWQGKGPAYTNGSEVIELSKGHDILLNGSARQSVIEARIKRHSMRPIDYSGLSPIPRILVSEGDDVKAGDILFHDKKNDKIKFCSPVSGEVVEIRRGEKRAIIDVIILADKEIQFRQLDPPSIAESTREEIVDFLCESGGWALLNERPYDVIPSIDNVPKNIFISTFDTAPLAPDASVQLIGKEESFQKGIDVLTRLTSGKVHLGLDASRNDAPPTAFTEATNCEKHWFKGKHPSGNVGIQIHHIAPIKLGDKVWSLTVQGVIALGELMHKGLYNMEQLVAVTGPQVKKPSYYKTYAGASINELLGEQLKEGKNRVIDGDSLSGQTVGEDDFLRSGSDQITVLSEGDNYEMFGWLLPLKPRPSVSKTFPNFLFPDLKFDADTNTHGEKRAFVMTGQYESVLPMDIYPQHLMKAIMANDYEKMEGLGITELSEEDVALCEFVCTSKMPLQKILREGLEMMREQE